jgi:hypothetical protein
VGGSITGTATLNLPGPSVTADLNTQACARSGSTAKVVLTPWQLLVDLAWKLGCITLPFVGEHCAYRGGTNLVNLSGPQTTLAKY